MLEIIQSHTSHVHVTSLILFIESHAPFLVANTFVIIVVVVVVVFELLFRLSSQCDSRVLSPQYIAVLIVDCDLTRLKADYFELLN